PRSLRMREDFSIGVLGLGVLGGAVAQALAKFGFTVSGWSRTPKTIEGVRCAHGSTGFDSVLAGSELLLVFLPLTGDTDGLLDSDALARLPEGAALANLSRGELVDDEALLEALDSGWLSEAYLDVFNREPLPREHRYWTHRQVRMTPHVAALTPYSTACAQVADKIRRLQVGESITGVVDRVRGY
ncbi:NAD(P)-dependent oxidoreductase, partial [Dokdonella sp.]|uniref:NAD(P)-dependent oxidoreductase n=1 Tax=Dokdonella sp. TaxID=2291710 RepID=UPI003C4B9C41